MNELSPTEKLEYLDFLLKETLQKIQEIKKNLE